MGGGRLGGYQAKQERQARQLNAAIKKAAKVAKRGKWIERKAKRHQRPKRKLKNYGLGDE